MDLKNIISGNIPEAILPNIDHIIINLKKRIARLRKNAKEALEIDDEIIYTEEADKSMAVLVKLQNTKQQYTDNDLSIVNTHSNLELEYFKAKKKLEDKMSNFQKLSTEDVDIYNSAVHKYNLFVNVVESV